MYVCMYVCMYVYESFYVLSNFYEMRYGLVSR